MKSSEMSRVSLPLRKACPLTTKGGRSSDLSIRIVHRCGLDPDQGSHMLHKVQTLRHPETSGCRLRRSGEGRHMAWTMFL